MIIPDFKTEGVKYMGSKKEMIPHIYDIIKDLDIKTAFDGFAGTTRIGQFLKKLGINVISNDINVWSRTFGECYLLNKFSKIHYDSLIQELNELTPIDGWFTENYGGKDTCGSSIQEDGKKKIWQLHVTQKLDAIRTKIEEWLDINKINKIEHSVLLTSLIIALDKVDSTLGHQVSYLSDWSKRSYNKLELRTPNFIINDTKNTVDAADTLMLNKTVKPDLAYFDPPYGSSNDIMPSSRVRYGQYYHLWKTVVLNDEPNLAGRINKRSDANTTNTYSVFEDYRKTIEGKFLAQIAIESLIDNSLAKYILLSYNTNARVPIPYIISYLDEHEYDYRLHYIDYKMNVMSSMISSREWLNLTGKTNYEMLLLISK